MIVFQCPKSGKFHFYGLPMLRIRGYPVFQCPKSGKFHFYNKRTEIFNHIEECFNALSRANSISTHINFLERILNLCFNALSRANSISTRSKSVDLLVIWCFNALSRANSISTSTTWKARSYITSFQCPKSGKFHFYEHRRG